MRGAVPAADDLTPESTDGQLWCLLLARSGAWWQLCPARHILSYAFAFIVPSGREQAIHCAEMHVTRTRLAIPAPVCAFQSTLVAMFWLG